MIAVPFDDNYIALESEIFLGTGETNYVNASRIQFDGLDQKFIAAQAPKPESFNHFWHMVIQEKVRTR